jgi:hypothetical protein
MNLMESLLRRLQAITDGEGNHMKYQPEEQYIQKPFSGPKLDVQRYIKTKYSCSLNLSNRHSMY